MFLSPIAGIVRLTQVFGVNRTTYAQFGLSGHNGLDLTGAEKGANVPLYSPIEGIVTEVGDEGKYGYGRYVRIRSIAPDDQGRYKEVILGHLSSSAVWKGKFLYQLDSVGISGGKPGTPGCGFSSGAHLHAGLRFLDSSFRVLNYNNGYKGYIDFLPYFRCWAQAEQKEAYLIQV